MSRTRAGYRQVLAEVKILEVFSFLFCLVTNSELSGNILLLSNISAAEYYRLRPFFSNVFNLCPVFMYSFSSFILSLSFTSGTNVKASFFSVIPVISFSYTDKFMGLKPI